MSAPKLKTSTIAGILAFALFLLFLGLALTASGPPASP